MSSKEVKNRCVTQSTGTKCWYVNGLLHRDNDLPAIEYFNGRKAWWVNGRLQEDKIAKCYWIDNGEKKFEWFDSIDKANKKMYECLKNKICSWVEANKL